MINNNFRFRKIEEMSEKPFFNSLYLFCEGKEEPFSLITVEVSTITLLGQALNKKKDSESVKDAYANAFLTLIADSQESLTINFIDTEYERSKQGISPNCIN